MIKPPIQATLVNANGFINRMWTLFFSDVSDAVSGRVPVQMQVLTVATVPSAASYEGGVIYVADESGGATLAFSDGSNWRRVQDRAIIS